MRALTVQALRVGFCRHPRIMTIRDGGLRPVDFPALAMLLIHPEEGPILFDTGYDRAFFAATKPFPERFYRWLAPPTLGADEDLPTQLRALGIDPGNVRHLILSHFHADHIAGTGRFPNAIVHCARAGHESCSKGRISALHRGILPALLPPDFASRTRYFEAQQRLSLPSDLAPFEDGVDLLGDGTLIAIELPGHCPGHWGLLVRDAGAGFHFMVADAAWSIDAIRRNMPPPAVTGALLGNLAQGRNTLARLHALWRRNPEVVLTPCHCAERSAELTGRL